MAKIVQGYIHYRTEGEAADAFALDTSVPLLLNHPVRSPSSNPAKVAAAPRAGEFIDLEQREDGIYATALIYDDTAADGANGFSVGTNLQEAKQSGNRGKLAEVSILTGDKRPGNKHCFVRQCGAATPVQAKAAAWAASVRAEQAAIRECLTTVARACAALADAVEQRRQANAS